MQEAYAIAMQNLKKSARRGQKNYNRRTWSSALEPGDHVLVRNLTPRGGPGKLRSYWEEAIHVIKERKGTESPVYVVEPLQGTGRRRVLHRNLLLPCPYLVEEPDVHEPILKEKSNSSKAEQMARRNHKHSRGTYLTDPDSSSEEEYHLWTTVKRADPSLNVEAEEFRPRMETVIHVTEETMESEEPLGEGDMEEKQSMEREVEVPATESEDEQNESETWRDRPKRVRQPRRVYTYDQLGKPTFQQLKICPVGAKWSLGTSHDLSTGSPLMYPFYHC